jgi:hypothetical protein
MPRLLWLACFPLCLGCGAALADLYRWVDPDTGSVKFSSYPPPWFGDAEKEKRAPKVEHIPERRPAPATPVPVPVPAANGLPGAAAAPGASPQPASPQPVSLEALEVQRKQLMLQLGAVSMRQELQSGGAALKKQLETFASISAEMDKLDPRGAEARRAEAQPVVERIVEDLRTQLKATGR